MTIKVSTGLQLGLLGSSGIREQLQGGLITLYPTPRRSHPNQAIVVAPLAYITQDGESWLPAPDNSDAGLLLQLVESQALLQKSGTWTLKGTSTGTVVWFSFTGPDLDPGNVSTALPRIDGDCGSDLILSSYAITPSTERALQAFEIK